MLVTGWSRQHCQGKSWEFELFYSAQCAGEVSIPLF
jgi:hypothetical protein